MITAIALPMSVTSPIPERTWMTLMVSAGEVLNVFTQCRAQRDTSVMTGGGIGEFYHVGRGSRPGRLARTWRQTALDPAGQDEGRAVHPIRDWGVLTTPQAPPSLLEYRAVVNPALGSNIQ